MKVTLSSSALALIVSLSTPARADLAPFRTPGSGAEDSWRRTARVEITLSYPRTNECAGTLFPELAGLGGGSSVGADRTHARRRREVRVPVDDRSRSERARHPPLVLRADPAAATADEFIAFFEKSGRREAHELITAAISDEKRRKRILEKFDKNYQLEEAPHVLQEPAEPPVARG